MPVQKIPYLYTAPGDRVTGIASVVDIATTGPNPREGQIHSLSMARIAYQRNTGKVLGIVEEYTGEAGSAQPLEFNTVDFILLRSALIIAYNSAFQRPFLTRVCPTAAQRPWRCAMNSIGWSIGAGSSLDDLMKAHRINKEELPMSMENIHGLLLLLSRTDNRGRSYLFQLIGM